MRILLIAMGAAIAATAAAPASAQYDHGRGYGYGYQQGRDIARQLRNLDLRIRRAADRDRISRREANRLLNRVDRLELLFAQYRRDGLSRWEHQDLQARIHVLRQRLGFDRRDGRRWDDRDRDDRRWDDRDRDDRRWDRDDDDDDRWDRDDDDDDRWDRDDDDKD